jgi:hypothetical protein
LLDFFHIILDNVQSLVKTSQHPNLYLEHLNVKCRMLIILNGSPFRTITAFA